MRLANRLILMALVVALWAGQAAALTLGAFTFNDQQFGNTLIESDGGTFSAVNYLNVVNANPGNPGYLTGANVNTGIANIGLGGVTPLYTIGYNTPIVNGPGDDFAIITARFSSSDTARFSVSTNGTDFLFDGSAVPGDAIATGVPCIYFYGGGGPFSCNLFVTPIDLSDLGVADGASMQAIRITGAPELDLIRVAGLGEGGDDVPTVPLPSSVVLMGLSLIGLAVARRRR